MKAIYTAHAATTGGREGRGKSDDGKVDVKLSPPKEMGGNGAGTNPEQLFAVGYSGCYLGAIRYVAGKLKKPLTISDDASVTAHVTLGSRTDKKGFGIGVKLDVSLPGLTKAQASSLTKKAHIVCPYSHSIKKNVKVVTKIV